MTAFGRCGVCGKTTGVFRYNQPRKDPNNINDGQWLCEEHDTAFTTPTTVSERSLSVSHAQSARKEERAKIKRRKKLW